MPKSKQKGNTWESLVAKKFSAWYGDEFHRLPASGALRWGSTIWTYGDILPPVGLHVCIEAKHWAEVSIEEFLGTTKKSAGKGKVVGWWSEQATRDAKRAEEELGLRKVDPLLIYKQDRGIPKLCLRPSLYGELGLELPNLLVMWSDEDPFCVVNLEEFLLTAAPAKFKEACS